MALCLRKSAGGSSLCGGGLGAVDLYLFHGMYDDPLSDDGKAEAGAGGLRIGQRGSVPVCLSGIYALQRGRDPKGGGLEERVPPGTGERGGGCGGAV